MVPTLYKTLDTEGWGRNGIDIWENMYSYTIYSLCFGSHIPLHVSTRVIEWVLLMQNEDHSLVVLLVYMLKICEPHILNLTDSSERFKYISQGKFIIECIDNKAFFDELVRSYLTVHVARVQENFNMLEYDVGVEEGGKQVFIKGAAGLDVVDMDFDEDAEDGVRHAPVPLNSEAGSSREGTMATLATTTDGL